MKFKMLEDNCLVLPLEEHKSASVSDGGILVPGKVVDRPIVAEVIAVGEGMKMDDGGRFKETLKVGDTVVFPKKSGDKVYLDGKNFIILPSRYVLMIIDSEEEEN